MNVLFYLEPAIEFGNPLFRYATLRNSFLPQIKSLQQAGMNVVTLMGLPVASQCLEDRHARNINTLAVIDPFEWMKGESYLTRAQRHHDEEYHEGEVERLGELLTQSLPDAFTPDVIIVWESPANFLNTLYPQAKILYQMPGFFSRPPFGQLVSLDIGLLKYAAAKTYEGNVVSNEEMDALHTLRLTENQFLQAVSPVKEIVADIYHRFSKVVLLPLQIDNYFMINSVIGNHKSQFDILVDILTRLPDDHALLVTNYKSKDAQSAVLTEQGITYLRSRFPNFIYRQETDNVPWVSQFLVPLVDGIITISSSIGFQAAFWQKPLLALGQSHLTPFATAATLDAFLTQAASPIPQNRDKLMLETIRHQHCPMNFLADSRYAEWLKKFVATGELTPWCDRPVGQMLLEERRESQLLDALGYFNNVRGESSMDHCHELSQQIIKHDIVSFDIFDTLLYRPFKSPTDLYTFINHEARAITGIATLDFKTVRRAAEKTAFLAAIERGEGEVTFEEIYQVLAADLALDETIMRRLMQAEMSAERELLYPRVSGYKAFLEAKSLKKRIIIISDMYLPESFLAEILEKNGYTGYERLFVSSTYRAKKHSGVLFDRVLEQMQVDPSRILHIGDNLDADVKRAKSRGLKPFHLIKASEVFEKNSNYTLPWSRDEARHALDWRMLLSIAGNRLHDNPYLPHRNGTVFGGSPWKLGYYGFGALLLGYTKWLLENAVRDGVEDLYFLSRDGKVMKAAYDAVAPLYPNAPRSHYLLCSRRAVNLAKVENMSDILDLLHVDFAHRVRLSHLLKHRFGINSDIIPQEILKEHDYTLESPLTAADIPRLEALFNDLQPILLAAAAEERTHYLDYLQQSGIYGATKNAIVDIGYAGTMQESLHQLSGGEKEIGGYYLMTFRQALKRVAQRNLPVRGYLAEFIDRHDTYHPFCRHVPLYETLFSSEDTSFICMTRDWEKNLYPVFMARSPIEARREEVVYKVQQGAIEFISEVVRILGPRFDALDIEPNKTLRIMDNYFNNPHPRDAAILSGVMFEDAYGGTAYKTILPDVNALDVPCVWQKGREVLLKDQAIKQAPAPAPKRAPKPAAPKSAAVPPAPVKARSHAGAPPAPRGVTHHVIRWVMLNTLSEKKKYKFEHKPHLFFNDAKNPLLRKLGKRYLKGYSNL
ncbi:HAD family hydrolase [Chimaeribacter arupi]|uniref:HAD family hydrolase n=1 Tax=Chimaeribacter arupi TaxID=2060066 RepID=UPI0011AF2F95|nr:HAD-IA family hydrolase [Chimaeribacter arupi]